MNRIVYHSKTVPKTIKTATFFLFLHSQVTATRRPRRTLASSSRWRTPPSASRSASSCSTRSASASTTSHPSSSTSCARCHTHMTSAKCVDFVHKTLSMTASKSMCTENPQNWAIFGHPSLSMDVICECPLRWSRRGNRRPPRRTLSSSPARWPSSSPRAGRQCSPTTKVGTVRGVPAFPHSWCSGYQLGCTIAAVSAQWSVEHAPRIERKASNSSIYGVPFSWSKIQSSRGEAHLIYRVSRLVVHYLMLTSKQNFHHSILKQNLNWSQQKVVHSQMDPVCTWTKNLVCAIP